MALRLLWLFCLVAALAVFAGCADRRGVPPGSSSRAPAPSASAPVPATPAPPASERRYLRVPNRGPGMPADLWASVGDRGARLILKLNRIDLAHAMNPDTLIVPEPLPELLALSPFPRTVRAAESVPKLFVVSARVQAFGAYESGDFVRWGPVSTGRSEYPTPPGLYHTNWKRAEQISTFNEEWVMRWCWNIESREGISIHQYDLPGRPASHACVRLMEDDARWIYGWAEGWRVSKDGKTVLHEGTPVLVIGEYAKEAPPPWRRLAEDTSATNVSAAEIEAALAAAAVPIAAR